MSIIYKDGLTINTDTGQILAVGDKVSEFINNSSQPQTTLPTNNSTKSSIIQIYYKDGSSMSIPSNDLSYWQNQGWTTNQTTNNTSTKSNNQSNQNNTNTTIGVDAVNHLYQLYLGRDANQNELNIYKNNSDDTTLRKDLEMARKIATENQNKTNEKNQIDPNSSTFFLDKENGSYIQFTSDPDGSGPYSTSTIFYADPKTNTLKPFLSEQAFQAFSGKTVAELQSQINKIPTPSLDSNGVIQSNQLKGFNLLPLQYAFQNDGSSNNPPVTIDSSKIATHYGYETDTDALWNTFQKVMPMFDWLRNNAQEVGISTAIIDQIKQDPNALALYVNALTYGGYKLSDILKDIKRQQLVANGQSDLSNIKVINEDVKASDYYSGAGANIQNNTSLQLPDTIGGINLTDLTNTIYNVPTNVFDTFSPTTDWTSEEGKTKLNEIQTAYHDILLQQVQATTDREKAIADANYEQLKNETQKKYGIILSNNALDAWNQITNLGSQANQQGIGSSGLAKEALDKTLASIRRSDNITREQKVIDEKNAKKDYYLKYATPDEINSLTEQERQDYGLAPTNKTDRATWIANFKSQYPNETDETASTYYDTMFDENGNYRSELYQTLINNKYLVKTGEKFGDLPTIMQYDTEGNPIGYKQVGSEDYKVSLATDEKNNQLQKELEDWQTKFNKMQTTIGGETIGTGVNTVQTPTVISNNSTAPTSSISSNIVNSGTINQPTTTNKTISTPSTSTTQTQPTTNNMQAFTDWTKGKTDVLGKNWSGYSAIEGSTYNTLTPEERKKKYSNVQAVGNTLYGYKNY